MSGFKTEESKWSIQYELELLLGDLQYDSLSIS